MSQAFACVGDMTDHGGRVISGNSTFIIAGRQLAQVGDLTVCPKCKGTFPITTGTSNFSVGDKQAAIHGSKTACGATIIAQQNNTGWLPPAGESSTSNITAAASALVAAVAPSICLECLIHAAETGASTVVRS
ncbi:PAAR domain-containing protein [Burkholderia sp. 22PA0099]|uniref:PAAR domain-containing protein n=1 Tax=Burkholderia sp. 22PA0099 TaxID=3237372 RepID=UPI0039C30D8D